MLKDLIHLMFPKSCNACYKALVSNEKEICTACRNELPLITDNQLKRILLKLDFKQDIVENNISCLFCFEKNTQVQELLHNLKYRQYHHLGETLGSWHAAIMQKNGKFTAIDLVIPIPIHKKRLRHRGYNQVTLYAQTVSKKLNAEYRDDILIKETHRKSQVFLNKQQRINNILDSLSLQNIDYLKGKNILILDDIVTTGATMKACISCLKDKVNSISFGSIALVSLEAD